MKKMEELKHYILSLLFVFTLTTESLSQQGWVQQVSGTSLNLYSVYFIDINTGFAAADNGFIVKTTNSGTNWISINTGANMKLWQILFVNSFTGFAGTDSNTIRTTNAGVTWDISIAGGGRSISFVNPTTGYAIKSCGNLMKTTNSGINWFLVATIPTTRCVDLIFFRNENTGFAGNKWTYSYPFYHNTLTIDKTINSGVNWASQYVGSWGLDAFVSDLFFLNDFFGVAVHTTAPPTQYYFSKSTNIGQNWNQVNLPQQMNSVRFTDVNKGWTCGVNGGILYSSNGGDNWSTQVSNVSTSLNGVFMVSQNTGWIVGNSGIILKTTSGGTTAIKPISNEIPMEYYLYQNYPNPFNPSTKIGFTVPLSKGGERGLSVRLVIYDVVGKETTTLVNEQLKPGTYEVEWDGSNYPSGVYFYRMIADGVIVDTKKLVIIK